MPSWSEILDEIRSLPINVRGTPSYDFESVLKKYINRLSKYRNRNAIIYYSDWLNRAKGPNIEINDQDMEGFMNACCGIDKGKGLDLILHTPGGNPLAAEGIVKFLHKTFGPDIEVFVPHMSMSAGTMLCCACKCIWMGKQSSLGPVDPQFSGIPAYNIKKEFEEAKKELVEKPDTFRSWQLRLDKYPPAFYYNVLDAIRLSSNLVRTWLREYMFKDDPARSKKIQSIVTALNANTGSHSKHFNSDDCKKIGLRINNLENDDLLQDAVLSIYHTLTIMGSLTLMCKMICNQSGQIYIVNGLLQGGTR